MVPVRVVHIREGSSTTIATRVEFADTFLKRARGLMFRRSIPENYAMAFQFTNVKPRTIHMVCVPFPLDAIWIQGNTVQFVETLSPWIGISRGRGDLLLEVPAGVGDAIRPGDTVEIRPA